MKPRTDWTTARLAQLEKQWAKGATAAAIATKLGVSRSAVLGMISRRGYTRMANGAVASQRRAPRPPPTAAPASALPAPKPKPPQPAAAAVPQSGSRGITYVQAGNSQCRYPLDGGTQGAPRCCGAPKHAGFDYCEGHVDLMWNVRPRRKKEPA